MTVNIKWLRGPKTFAMTCACALAASIVVIVVIIVAGILRRGAYFARRAGAGFDFTRCGARWLG